MPARKTTAKPKATTAKKTTTTKRKTTTAPKAAVAKAPPAPTPTVVEESKPSVSTVIKKPELIDKVVERSGMKKKDVKPVVEAMLEELGQLLTDGAELNLPPLGKVSINRTKDLAKATVMIVKVRTPKADAEAAKTDKTPLADEVE